jgi:tetratricopeptide (TPR) repeat protein
VKASAKEFMASACRAALVSVVLLIQAHALSNFPESPDHTTEPVNQPSTLVAAAEQAYSENRFHEAVKLYSKAITIDPADSSVFMARGMAYEMLNQLEKASEDYKRALEIDRTNFRAMENLAGIFERGGKYIAEAAALYRIALELDPRPVWRENLAFWIAVLEQRLEPEDQSAVGCWNLGNRKAQKGDSEKAEYYYSRAIELDPVMFQAYYSRALLRFKGGDLAASLHDFDAVVRLCPSLRGCLVSRGLTHELLGSEAKAFADFQYAVKADPRDPNAHYHLGRMLEKENEYGRALQSYVDSLRLKPNTDLRNLLQARVNAVLGSGKLVLKGNSIPRLLDKDLR